MKNREERPKNSDRGASQRTFDFGDEVERPLPANLLRPELTDPAFVDTPSLNVSSDVDLMELVVDPQNLERAWRQVRRNRGAPGPDGMTITEFDGWCVEHWPVVKQQLLNGMYRPSPVRRKTIPKDGGGERPLGIPNVLDRLIQQAICQASKPRWCAIRNASKGMAIHCRSGATPMSKPNSFMTGNEAFIVHSFRKYLKTLESDLPNLCDTGDLVSRPQL